MVNYARATSQRETTKGCVQGSIGGPTFWNIILDPLLHKLEDKEHTVKRLQMMWFWCSWSHHRLDRGSSQLDTRDSRGMGSAKQAQLRSTQSAMLLTKKFKYDPPRLVMSGSSLTLVTEMKLLGLTIDRNLTFKTHDDRQMFQL